MRAALASLAADFGMAWDGDSGAESARKGREVEEAVVEEGEEGVKVGL